MLFFKYFHEQYFEFGFLLGSKWYPGWIQFISLSNKHTVCSKILLLTVDTLAIWSRRAVSWDFSFTSCVVRNLGCLIMIFCHLNIVHYGWLQVQVAIFFYAWFLGESNFTCPPYFSSVVLGFCSHMSTIWDVQLGCPNPTIGSALKFL